MTRAPWYTVEQVAARLQVHPKTVLRYIREGRLRATRIGRPYRVLGADLEAFAGGPDAAASGGATHAEAPAAEAVMTTVVEVPSVRPELAQKWARAVPNALQAKPHGTPLRADVVYTPDSRTVKILISGGAADCINLLNLIRVWLDQRTA